MMEFDNRAKDMGGGLMVSLKKDLYLTHKSNEHLIKSINLSWSNLTDKDLRENNRSGFLFSSSLFLAENYFRLHDYDNAEKYLEIIRKIILISPESKENKKWKEVIDRFGHKKNVTNPYNKKVKAIIKSNTKTCFFEDGKNETIKILEPNETDQITVVSSNISNCSPLEVNFIKIENFNVNITIIGFSLFGGLIFVVYILRRRNSDRNGNGGI